MRDTVRRVGGTLLKSGLSVALVVLLLGRLDTEAVWHSVKHADVALLIAAGAVLILSNLAGSLQWGLLLRAQGLTPPWPTVISSFHIGLFFNNLLPANVGGDVARIHGVSGYSAGLSPVVSATVMDRLIGLFVIAAFGVAAAPLGMREVHQPVIYGSVVLTFLGAGAALLAARSRRLTRLALRPVRGLGFHALADRADRTLGSLRALALRTPVIVGVTGIAVGTQILRLYVHYLVARGLGIQVSQAALWTFVPVLAVVAALPVSLNGLGVREWAATRLLPHAGLAPEAAFAWQLTTAVVAMAISLSGAALFVRNALRPERREAAKAARVSSTMRGLDG